MEFLIQPMEGLRTSLQGLANFFVCFCGHNIYQCGCNSVVGCGCPPSQVTEP